MFLVVDKMQGESARPPCIAESKHDVQQMRVRTLITAGLLLAGFPGLLRAQIPTILGTWKLNIDQSKLPSSKPQLQVRSYQLLQEGLLMGVAITIDAEGRPNFLQFVAMPDGEDYREFSTESAADYLKGGIPPPRTYSEMPTDDPLKVRWLDKLDGKLLFSGERWVSRDGQTMSFTVNMKDAQGSDVQYLYVFDCVGKSTADDLGASPGQICRNSEFDRGFGCSADILRGFPSTVFRTGGRDVPP